MTSSAAEDRPRVPVAILAGAFLFNLGQGVLRPSLPLYLQRSFGANYRMVTLIPVVFGAGKWVASVPTGYLLDRLGRQLMIWGLLLIAIVDVGSSVTDAFGVFLGLRALGGVGWAMFATVATTAMVNVPSIRWRGRAVSLLLMSETGGLLLGSAVGGSLYQRVGTTSPFLFEATSMMVAAGALARWASRAAPVAAAPSEPRDWRRIQAALRMPGVLVMGTTSAALMCVQTGVLVFLFPLYLVQRGGVSAEAGGLLLSLSVLGRLVALWLGGNLSDRRSRMRVLIPGLLSYAVCLGAVAFLVHPIALGLGSLGLGVTAGFVAPLPPAIVGDHVPSSLQGMAIGWLRMMMDTGQVLGPLVMGALADAVDLTAPFLVGAALLLATAWQCRRRADALSAFRVVETRDA